MIKFSEHDMEMIKRDVINEVGVLYLLNAEDENIREILMDFETINEYIEIFKREGYFFFRDSYSEFVKLLQTRVYYEDNLSTCIADERLVDKILSFDVEYTFQEEVEKANAEYKLRCEEKYEPVLKFCKDCAADLDAESKDGRCSLCIEAKEMYELHQKSKSIFEEIMKSINMEEYRRSILAMKNFDPLRRWNLK